MLLSARLTLELPIFKGQTYDVATHEANVAQTMTAFDLVSLVQYANLIPVGNKALLVTCQ